LTAKTKQFVSSTQSAFSSVGIPVRLVGNDVGNAVGNSVETKFVGLSVQTEGGSGDRKAEGVTAGIIVLDT